MAVFTAVMAAYVLISFSIGYAMGTIAPYAYPLNAENLCGTLGFQLLLSGPSEELLFRALPVTLLAGAMGKKERGRGISAEVIIAALLFSIAHVNWSFYPAAVSFDWIQLVTALVLGLVYGVVYQRTRSILYPMLMHSISNVLMVGTGWLFAAFAR